MATNRTESVERAMSILSAFSTQKPIMSLAELAEETGLHKSTILRLTNSMRIYGFIQRDEDGRFSVGPSVWRLALIFRRDFTKREHVAPALRILAEATGETASFYVRAGNERVCLYRENSPNLLRFHVEEGMRLRLSTGASGLVLRRYSGEDMDDFSSFNENGTASSVGQTNPNISSISTPVFSAVGELVGALTVSGLATRFDEEARARAIPLLERLAHGLTTT
ncbi:IclR family transcriptional regulator [Roseibium album]|uniref:IclR family transcriptional regulator n=1 Tax=Roseibium album TaxID=311410 RepID=UPI0018CAA2E0|nr:DNA-binding IclR family transcriptional regulator [Labrenzia sp. EL_162]MBG6193260.1 DNA-binding IclR family transcriptional regulator [Labrenzia sp. EL_159]